MGNIDLNRSDKAPVANLNDDKLEKVNGSTIQGVTIGAPDWVIEKYAAGK